MGSRRARCVAAVWWFWLGGRVVLSQDSDYLKYCDEIISLGREASGAHNRGDDGAAAASLAAAQKAFEAAIALDDGEPQAWLNAANLALNTHRFELALDLWEGAKERVAGIPDAARHVEERVQTTLLGLYSTKRDASYASGEGDVREAISWSEKQLEATPGNPRAEHDLATLCQALDEVDPGPQAQRADELYRASQRHAADAMARYFRCLAAFFPDEADVDVDAAAWDGSAPFFGAAPRVDVVANALIAGPDAVVLSLALQEDDGMCASLAVHGAAAPWVELHGNAWLDQTWRKGGGPYDHSAARRFPPPKPGPPQGLPRIKRAALAVSFASANYYHFVADVLPRVVFLRPDLEADPGLKLIIPKVSPDLKALLALVLPPGFLDKRAKRAVEMDVSNTVPPGPRAKVDALKVVALPRVAAADNRPTHALTPAPLLRAARDAVLAAVAASSSAADDEKKRTVVVYCRRGATKLRAVDDEAAVEARLKDLASATVEVAVFDGGDATPLDAVALFRRADVVVGVHGAALANALFCAPKTTLVEFGFAASAARHYEHLAFALGLRYVRVPLAADERSFSTKAVALSDADVNAARAAIAKAARAARKDGEL